MYLLYAHARICSIIRKSGKDIEELKKVSCHYYQSTTTAIILYCIIFLSSRYTTTFATKKDSYDRQSCGCRTSSILYSSHVLV